MARTKRLSTFLTPDEFLRLAAAAEARAMPLTVWVRHQLLRAAVEPSKLPFTLQAPPRRSPADQLARTTNTKLTEEQFEAVEERARACGMTVSCFIRQLILGHKPIARRPPIRSAIVAVNRASAKLNQLVQPPSSGTVLTTDLMRAVAGVLEEIHSLRDACLSIDAANSRKRPE